MSDTTEFQWLELRLEGAQREVDRLTSQLADLRMVNERITQDNIMLTQANEAMRNEPRWEPDWTVRIAGAGESIAYDDNCVTIKNGTVETNFTLPVGYALCVLVDPADPLLRKNQVAQ